MINIVVRGASEVRAQLDRIERQIPFATALALTRTADLTKKAIEAEMTSVFDRPTRWTLNSLRLFPAKKDKLEARVWMKNEAGKSLAPTESLQPQIQGGGRRKKRGEQGLQARGVLPAGKYAMPGKGVRRNAAGNMSGSQTRKILAGLGGQYFVLGRGDTAVGIAQRTSKRTLKVLLAFVSRPNYSKALDFYGIGNKVAMEHLGREMRKALEHAIRTAR